MDYKEFLNQKAIIANSSGIDIDDNELNENLFDFQDFTTRRALRKGRHAIFGDTGSGKTLMYLVWAQKIVEATNGNVLILTPLAVSYQTTIEAEKFGIECKRSIDGKPTTKITVTNYEKIQKFNRNDFIACICDESAVIKNHKSQTKKLIIDFMRYMKYRLLCTATPSPNDYTEIGNSSEALGFLGYDDMLTNFFINNDKTHHPIWERQQWALKPHAEKAFWQWMCSWSTAFKRPSDLGFSDNGFILPPLEINEIIVDITEPLPGELYVRKAITPEEQRQERRNTWKKRCELAAEIINNEDISIAWCQYQYEADALESLIDDCEQVKGSDSDEKKRRNSYFFFKR